MYEDDGIKIFEILRFCGFCTSEDSEIPRILKFRDFDDFEDSEIFAALLRGHESVEWRWRGARGARTGVLERVSTYPNPQPCSRHPTIAQEQSWGNRKFPNSKFW